MIPVIFYFIREWRGFVFFLYWDFLATDDWRASGKMQDLLFVREGRRSFVEKREISVNLTIEDWRLKIEFVFFFLLDLMLFKMN